eukprot:TRINITY_DN13905_c0_g1_i3.p1 TRINITY_DN13905_c0_g1~~TRINITY_DN13905_c0_g1_i3.p1  ORF type:complete len:155 (+),score=37.73 TRINITY_DN13905_c0_g1_i3:73-537(+)
MENESKEDNYLHSCLIRREESEVANDSDGITEDLKIEEESLLSEVKETKDIVQFADFKKFYSLTANSGNFEAQSEELDRLSSEKHGREQVVNYEKMINDQKKKSQFKQGLKGSDFGNVQKARNEENQQQDLKEGPDGLDSNNCLLYTSPSPRDS